MVESFYIVKFLSLATISFVVAMLWTPILTKLLYELKMGKSLRSEKQAPTFHKMHEKKAGTPTMGGVLIWGTALALAVLFMVIDWLDPASFFGKLDFLSRKETWLPLGALISAGLVGLVDDFLNAKKIGKNGGGIDIRHRLILYSLIALVGAWWFYFKLGFDVLHIPFYGDVNMGFWYIPFFFVVIVGTSFSVNQTDGLDGLAGGTLLSSFAAMAIISLLQGRFELAAFIGVIVGALIAFLWFNIYPARFFMGDTGAMSMGVTLGIVAMLTNTALLLPVIGIIFVLEAVTTIVQILSKKIRHKKVFLVAPIHHHFEALGWPEPKVVMRFWVLSWIAAAVGIVLAILDMTII